MSSQRISQTPTPKPKEIKVTPKSPFRDAVDRTLTIDEDADQFKFSESLYAIGVLVDRPLSETLIVVEFRPMHIKAIAG
jgi:hypothetical protein